MEDLKHETFLDESVWQTLKEAISSRKSVYQSPGKSLLILVLLTFIFEEVVMVSLSYLPEFSIGIEAIIAAGFLLVLLAPSLYLVVFRPLVLQINERKKAEAEQRRLNKSLADTATETARLMWLKTGQTELNDKMRGEQSIVNLSRNVISYFVNYLEAQVGVIYLTDEDNTLRLTGSCAYVSSEDRANEFKFGEGLVGQAALEEKHILTSDIPDDYIKINSAWGDAVPNSILVVPFLYEGEVKGVIELGSFNEFTDTQVEFLKLVAEPVAVAFNTTQTNLHTRELLEETQAQAEELQTQQEELKVANEELEEQTRALKEGARSRAE